MFTYFPFNAKVTLLIYWFYLWKIVCLMPVTELPDPNQSPPLTSFACLTFLKVCTKTYSSENRYRGWGRGIDALYDITKGIDTSMIPVPCGNTPGTPSSFWILRLPKGHLAFSPVFAESKCVVRDAVNHCWICWFLFYRVFFKIIEYPRLLHWNPEKTE